jgi:hypothetical protein
MTDNFKTYVKLYRARIDANRRHDPDAEDDVMDQLFDLWKVMSREEKLRAEAMPLLTRPTPATSTGHICEIAGQHGIWSDSGASSTVTHTSIVWFDIAKVALRNVVVTSEREAIGGAQQKTIARAVAYG